MNDKIKIWKEKTKGLFNIVEWTRFWNYITNLQQENEVLNDSVTWWNNRFNAVQRDYEDYKSRIEKALHLITHSDINDYRVFDEELLDILNGDNNE